MVSGLGGGRGVFPHHVVIDQSRASEQREAAGRAEDAAEDVLSGLLKPVAHRVLKLLIPGNVARARRVNPTARCPHSLNK